VRVTTQMSYYTLFNSMTSNLEKYNRTAEELSTGVALTQPSDDPTGIVDATSLKQSKAACKQYLDNLTVAKEYLTALDDCSQQISDQLTHARQIAEQAATETSDAEARAIAADEIQSIIESVLEVANTTVRGNYIFAGYNTAEQAYGTTGRILEAYNATGNTYAGTATSGGEFTGTDTASYLVRVVTAGDVGTAEYQVSEDGGETWGTVQTLESSIHVFDDANGEDLGVTLGFTDGTFAEGDEFRVDVVPGGYNGDDGAIEYNIGKNSRIQVNVTGQEMFEDTGLLDALYKLKNGCEDNNTYEISEALEDLGTVEDNLQPIMVKAGIRLDRVETATNSLTTMKENITNSISNIEQADLIETAAQLTLQQSALSASQSALSAVLQISLFNYL